MEIGHDSRSIANEFIRIGREKGVPITMMKLIKLVFFAHGWHLGLYGRPLVSEQPEAWKYGPVFRNLYHSLPYSGSQVIESPIASPLGGKFEAFLSIQQAQLMEKVFNVYGHLGAFALSEKTHEEGSPWKITVDEKGLNSSIEDGVIQNYFREQARKNAERSSV